MSIKEWCDNCNQIPCRCYRIGYGVGSCLKKKIPSFFASKECGCAEHADELDVLGPDLCIEQFDSIVETIVSRAAKWMIPRTIARMQITKWLGEAIEEARVIEESITRKPADG